MCRLSKFKPTAFFMPNLENLPHSPDSALLIFPEVSSSLSLGLSSSRGQTLVCNKLVCLPIPLPSPPEFQKPAAWLRPAPPPPLAKFPGGLVPSCQAVKEGLTALPAASALGSPGSLRNNLGFPRSFNRTSATEKVVSVQSLITRPPPDPPNQHPSPFLSLL